MATICSVNPSTTAGRQALEKIHAAGRLEKSGLPGVLPDDLVRELKTNRDLATQVTTALYSCAQDARQRDDAAKSQEYEALGEQARGVWNKGADSTAVSVAKTLLNPALGSRETPIPKPPTHEELNEDTFVDIAARALRITR